MDVAPPLLPSFPHLPCTYLVHLGLSQHLLLWLKLSSCKYMLSPSVFPSLPVSFSLSAQVGPQYHLITLYYFFGNSWPLFSPSQSRFSSPSLWLSPRTVHMGFPLFLYCLCFRSPFHWSEWIVEHFSRNQPFFNLASSWSCQSGSSHPFFRFILSALSLVSLHIFFLQPSKLCCVGIFSFKRETVTAQFPIPIWPQSPRNSPPLTFKTLLQILLEALWSVFLFTL